MRSMGLLNSVQRLFSHHMIETFGCDYSTSGVTLEALQAKLKAFLELRTADGPRHDTYVVFYSGHTQRTGAWALAGEGHHSLQWLAGLMVGWLAGWLPLLNAQASFLCLLSSINVYFAPIYFQTRSNMKKTNTGSN